MILSRLAVILLVFFTCNSVTPFLFASQEFITAVQEKGITFIVQKSAFSSEEPRSKKNAVLHASQIYPDTQVCVVDGSYAYSEVDLNLPAFGLEISRIYRSFPDRIGLFGSGWKLAYQMQLAPLDFDGAPAIAIEKADGQIIIFQQGLSGFVSPFGNLLRLTQNDDGTYLLTELGIRRISFDRQGRLSKIIENKNVNLLEMLYDLTTNRLTEIRSGSQVLIRFMYNSNGQIEALEDFTGRRYLYRYDEANCLVEVIDPLQQRLRYQYNEDGYLRAIVDRRGNFQTEIAYAPNGQVKSYTRNGEKYRLQYLDETRTVITNSQTHQWIYRFLPSGMITQIQDPYGNIASRKYDKFSRLIQKTDKRGATTKYLYDDANHTRRVINHLGSIITHIYKDREWVIKVPPGKITTVRFNENGDIVEDALGTDENVLHRNRYVYDAAGNLVQYIDPIGNTTQFAYNSDGNLVQKIDAAGNVTRWRYDTLGRIVWEKGPTGQITETSYDLLGRVSEINRTNGSVTKQ